MNTRRRSFLGQALLLSNAGLGLWLSGSMQNSDATEKSTRFRTMTWEELVPKDWDALKRFRDRNLDNIREGDSKELALMQEMRTLWDNAPTRNDLNGVNIRLPGFVVPLEFSRGDIKEFLLVPYFGACIHSPPPPANQIIHVVLSKPKPLRTMEAVWASGTLKIKRQDSAWGVSGYNLQGLEVVPYQADAR